MKKKIKLSNLIKFSAFLTLLVSPPGSAIQIMSLNKWNPSSANNKSNAGYCNISGWYGKFGGIAVRLAGIENTKFFVLKISNVTVLSL